MSCKRVAVGSANRVKIAAVNSAFGLVWPNQNWDVQGVEVPSDVSAQPKSDEECIMSAKNRALKAKSLLLGEWCVGIEAGLQQIGNEWFDSAWAVVFDPQGNSGLGTSARLHVPQKMMVLVDQGLELGEIDDMLFGLSNSKQQGGHHGIMTKGLITRQQAIRDGVISALTRFLHPELFQ